VISDRQARPASGEFWTADHPRRAIPLPLAPRWGPVPIVDFGSRADDQGEGSFGPVLGITQAAGGKKATSRVHCFSGR
jgi:hypothetical protein